MARKKKNPSSSDDVPVTEVQPEADTEAVESASAAADDVPADAEAAPSDPSAEAEPEVADEHEADAVDDADTEPQLVEDDEAEVSPADETTDQLAEDSEAAADEDEPELLPDDAADVDADDDQDVRFAPPVGESASPAYVPPPPYDPNAIPITKVTAPGYVPPVSADYMLANALGAPTQKKRNRTALLVLAGAGVIGLVAGIIWAAPALVPGLFAPASNATPKAAVETYLNALASGDSATALKAAVTTPVETTLLTDEVLKASQQRAPITNIVVKDATGSSSATVSATYQLGSTPVTASFATKKVGNEWRLVTITRDIQLTGIDKVKTTLNGVVPTDTAHLTLFPGSYVIASTNDRLAISGGEFVVQSPTDFANPTTSVQITKKGVSDARAAAQTKLNACLKKKELVPEGCGFGVKAGDVKVKSVKWTITSGGGALKNAIFRVGTDNPYVSVVYPYVQLEASVYDTSGRHYTGSDTITTVKADLSGADVVVTFNS